MSMETVEGRCKVTGNPCGTDTWKVGDSNVCGCEACHRWIRTQPKRMSPSKRRREEVILQGRRVFWQELLTAINESHEDAVRIVTRQLRLVEFEADRLVNGLGRLSQRQRQQIAFGEAQQSGDTGESQTPPPAEVARRRVPVQSWVKK